MRNPVLLLALLLLAIVAAMAGKSLLVSLPDVRDAAAGEFDADRAAARLARILGDQRPHPTDSAANDGVRERIVAELRRAGLQPQVRDQLACNALHKQRGVTCARVRNVFATIGPPAGRHLLLSAHYDSTPVGPGAGDAGAGVASLLEVASIVANARPRRPVTFLFNEGEELGLVGARAFLADPLSRNVDSLINLEARGVTGPANMFETSRPNAPAVAAFASAVERPVANSLATDVYRLMPNYTDVNTFEERGWLTLNIAIIGNETRYHSPGDNLAALDRRSLQHMGEQALALTRELSAGAPHGGGEKLFMDLLGRGLVTLPMAIGLTLLELLLLGFAWVAWRRHRLGRGLATTLAALIVATALAWAGQWLVGIFRPGMFWRAYPHWSHLAVYASAIVAGLAMLATIGRRLEPRQLRPAFWLVFLLIGTLLALVAPGGAIYFIFPPMFALAGTLAKRWWRHAELVGSWLAILLLYSTWGAMLALLEELLNIGPLWLFAPLGSMLILPVLIEAQPLIGNAGRHAATALGGAIVLAGWAAAAAAPAYSAERKQQFTIEHVTDWKEGRSHWSVLNDLAPLPPRFGQVDRWTLGELPQSKRKRWLAAAPRTGALPAPAIQILGKTNVTGGRRVTIRLRANGAQTVALIAKDGADIRAAGTGAFVRPIDRSVDDGPYTIRCFGRSCDGLVMEVLIGKSAPVDFVVASMRPGLPPSAAPLLKARPRNAQPQYAPDATIALARVRL